MCFEISYNRIAINLEFVILFVKEMYLMLITCPFTRVLHML
jgi:hypothetical protein